MPKVTKVQSKLKVENTRSSYKFYKQIDKDPIDIKRYIYIVNGFFKFAMRKVFEGFDVALAGENSFGYVGIRGRKQEIIIDSEGNIKAGLAPSWAETKKLWDSDPVCKAERKIVYCFNEHSNGIRYRLQWMKGTKMRMKNKDKYQMSFSRTNRRECSRRVFAGQEFLLIVTSKQKRDNGKQNNSQQNLLEEGW